jgi:hypothetical protein
MRRTRTGARSMLLAALAGSVFALAMASAAVADQAPGTARRAPARPPALHVRTGAHVTTPRDAGTAPAGSLVYYKNGNIYVSNTDGTGAQQVTTGGGWLYASMADDGTLVAEGPGETAPDGTQGMDLYVMDRTGHLDHKMTTPSDYSTFSWPAYPPDTVRISPDAQKIAYWNWEGGEQLTLWTPTSSTNLNFPNQTLGQENNEHPAWIDATHFMTDDPSAWQCFVDPPDKVFKYYKTGNGDDTAASWFDDTSEGGGCFPKGWAYGFDPTITRAGDKIAIVEDDAANWADGQPRKVVIRLFATNGAAPKAPTFKCQIALNASKFNTDKGGQWVGYASPSFTADGTELAWGDVDGIHVTNVSDLSDCSTVTSSLMIAGAALPQFSAAGASQAPALTLSKRKGKPGVSITANGSGFGAGEKVNLTFVDHAGTSTSLGQATADGSGSFSMKVTIPATAKTGKGKVTAKGASSGLTASATFRVT